MYKYNKNHLSKISQTDKASRNRKRGTQYTGCPIKNGKNAPDGTFFVQFKICLKYLFDNSLINEDLLENYFILTYFQRIYNDFLHCQSVGVLRV